VTYTQEFAEFIGAVPGREVALPWGRARVWDLGDGPAIVLLHGIAGGRNVFFRVAPLLATNRRVIIPPLRGEDRPCSPMRVEELLDDLAALLAALDLRDVTLVGFSFGGFLTLAYGGRNDPRVTRVVTQGAFAHYRLRITDRVALALAAAAPQALGAWYFRRRVLRGRETRVVAEHAPGLEILNAQWAGRIPIPTLASRTRIIGGVDLTEPVRSIEAPLTIAHGRLDGVVPFSSFERLQRLRPDARAVAWDGVSHMASLTHPELVAGLVS